MRVLKLNTTLGFNFITPSQLQEIHRKDLFKHYHTGFPNFRNLIIFDSRALGINCLINLSSF